MIDKVRPNPGNGDELDRRILEAYRRGKEAAGKERGE